MTMQENVQCPLHGQFPFLGLRATFGVVAGGVKFMVTPRVFSTVSTFPTWQVGLPCSTSMMKRRPVPEVMAKSFWVAPICLRTDFTSSPICFGVYFMVANGVTVREYNGGFGSKASYLFPNGNNGVIMFEIFEKIPVREYDNRAGNRAIANQDFRRSLASSARSTNLTKRRFLYALSFSHKARARGRFRKSAMRRWAVFRSARGMN